MTLLLKVMGDANPLNFLKRENNFEKGILFFSTPHSRNLSSVERDLHSLVSDRLTYGQITFSLHYRIYVWYMKETNIYRDTRHLEMLECGSNQVVGCVIIIQLCVFRRKATLCTSKTCIYNILDDFLKPCVINCSCLS